MKLYFETDDILDALRDRLKTQVNINEETSEVDIEFKNGRGDAGPTAVLDIVPKGTIAKRRAQEAAEAAEKAAQKGANKDKKGDTAPKTDAAPQTDASTTAAAEASADAAATTDAADAAPAKAPGSLFG